MAGGVFHLLKGIKNSLNIFLFQAKPIILNGNQKVIPVDSGHILILSVGMGNAFGR